MDANVTWKLPKTWGRRSMLDNNSQAPLFLSGAPLLRWSETLGFPHLRFLPSLALLLWSFLRLLRQRSTRYYVGCNVLFSAMKCYARLGQAGQGCAVLDALRRRYCMYQMRDPKEDNFCMQSSRMTIVGRKSLATGSQCLKAQHLNVSRAPGVPTFRAKGYAGTVWTYADTPQKLHYPSAGKVQASRLKGV